MEHERHGYKPVARSEGHGNEEKCPDVLLELSAASQWAPSYKRATWLQAPLALLSFPAGTAAWLLGDSVLWFAAALLVLAVVPFTSLVIMPTNHMLLSPGRDLHSPETRALLEKWGTLHAVRTGLGLVATSMFIWLLCGA